MATAAVATTKAPAAPNVIDWMSRLRVPLAAVAVGILALDAIGLAVHWADSTNAALRDQAAATQQQAQTRVTQPGPVVDGSRVGGGSTSALSGDTTSGGTNSGTAPLIGPVAPPVVAPAPTSPTPTPLPSPAVPLAQIDAVIPGVAQVSLGLGDNSCTTIDLTLLALGGCPTPSGDGPVILHLGGTLLGEK